ncbi:MAG TPA: hypothetical protein VF421_04770 [Niabella sp.]
MKGSCIKHSITVFLALSILFAAVSPAIITLCGTVFKKESTFSGGDVTTEKEDVEAKKLSPEKEFINTGFFAEAVTAFFFNRLFNDFSQPYRNHLYDSTPTPPPRSV